MPRPQGISRRSFIRQSAAACAALHAHGLTAHAATDAVSISPKNPFFAMDTGTRDDKHQTPESQARLLKELGFDGIGWSPQQVPEMLAALDVQGLRMFNVYLGVDIDGQNRTAPSPVLTLIDQLKGRDTALWLPVTSSKFSKPSDEAGDELAVPLLRDIARRAEDAGLKVALYPHTWSWLERIQDALRLVRKVDRQNLGVTFNLCHCLRVGDESRIHELLQEARSRLFFVTINGADHSGDWDRLIQPLGRGSFELAPVLHTLMRLNYTGPIGLQHFGIKGDARQNLAQSMQAWRKIQTQL
jgi:sugar phosphate isomerase/epimerase